MRKKVVSPAHRRAAAQQVVAAGLCSQRVGCRFLRLARSTYGYRGRPPTTAEQQLRKRLSEMVLQQDCVGGANSMDISGQSKCLWNAFDVQSVSMKVPRLDRLSSG
jgi:hypothetical protein